jgi:ribosomal protein S12 methylthiotransferase accessory factor
LAKNLRTGAKTWVLASQLYYKFPSVFSDFVAQVTSSGLAAGTDVESATMRAVLELIERDAIMVAWLCREPGRRLPINLCDAETRYIAGELMSAGASVAFHLLEGAGKIPVVLCAATGDGVSWPGLSATAAAHPSLRLAARGAVLEQAVSGFGLMRMLREGSGPRPMRPEEVRCGQFLDHACYYVPKREEELAFLRNAPSYEPEVESYDRPIPSLAELAARLAGDGVEIAVADLTPPDVASASIHVVRAVAAGLQPLHCGFGMEFRGSWRLRHWRRKALNPAPHPFC